MGLGLHVNNLFEMADISAFHCAFFTHNVSFAHLSLINRKVSQFTFLKLSSFHDQTRFKGMKLFKT